MNKTVNSMKSFHPKKAVTFATIKKVEKWRIGNIIQEGLSLYLQHCCRHSARL